MPSLSGRTTPAANPYLVCAAAWAVPGAGHLWLGRYQKGLTLLVVLPLMFAVGLGIRGRIFPFQFDDLQGIGKRDLAREIVVEAPGNAGADDRQRAGQAQERRLSRPGQHCRAGNQARHAERDPPVEVLVENEPRHEGRRHAFQGAAGELVADGGVFDAQDVEPYRFGIE